MVDFSKKIHLLVINFAMGAKASLKYTLATWKYLFDTNNTLYLTNSPNASFLMPNTHLHPILLLSFRRLVNSYKRWPWTNCSFFALRPPICSHFWISMLRKNLKDHSIMPHWPVFLLCWGRMSFFHCSLGGSRSFFVESLNAAIIFHKYYDCNFVCNQVISLLLFGFITIITRRQFGRFVHNKRHSAFIFPTLTHQQIVSNARAILHESTSLFFMIFKKF